MAVWHTAPGAEGLASVSGDLRLSTSMYFTYSDQNRTFDHIGIWFAYTATVTGIAEPEQVRTIGVSDGLLQALSVPPMLGRLLTGADQTPDAAADLAPQLRILAEPIRGDRPIVGRVIQVDGAPREIIGVMPRGFRIADQDADLIFPARFDRRKQILAGFGYQSIARLKPGVTIADASADIARLIPIWMAPGLRSPTSTPRCTKPGASRRPSGRSNRTSSARSATRSGSCMGTLAIVMLIACANVATLLLVRAEARHQELAIRAALGAGSARIVRALLVESVLLGLAGGLLGLALALRWPARAASRWRRPAFHGSKRSPSIRVSCCSPSRFPCCPASCSD